MFSLSDEEQAAIAEEEEEEKEEETPEPAPEPEPEPETETVPEPAPEPEPAPIVPDIQAELDAINSELDDGDIGLAEYNKKRDVIVRKQIELEVKALFVQQQEDQLKARWKQDQDAFFVKNSDLKNDNSLFKLFAKQTNLKISDPEYSNVSNIDLLKEAAMEARAISGAKNEVANARRNANKSAAKTIDTLSEVPAAAANDDSDPVFAAIDKLLDSGDTEALESALAKMTPEQMNKYAMI